MRKGARKAANGDPTLILASAFGLALALIEIKLLTKLEEIWK
jgi:hypothetical protein